MNSDLKKYSPPRWADRFLEWYCDSRLLEEIQGDAYELFYRNLKESKRKANLHFIWNVIRFFRLKNIKKSNSFNTSNPAVMFRSYLLIGFRNAIRHGATSFINVFGLAIGVAATITTFIFVDQFYHTDDFQIHRDRIVEVTAIVKRENKNVITSDVPLLLGPAMQADIPGIEEATRIEFSNGSIRYGDKVFSEKIYFVDDNFFRVFNFPMTEGNAQALDQKNSIVINKIMAEKYFGDEVAAGKTVSVKFINNEVKEFTIAAVVDQPDNNTLYFDILIRMDVFVDLNIKDSNSWNYMTDATFLLMKPGFDIESSQAIMSKYKKFQNESSPEWPIEGFKFYTFNSMPSLSYEIESAVVGSGHPQGVLTLLFLAIMLLLLACFNYMNISIATITTRLKEIGIRKVIGGHRRQIMIQFITENFLLSGFALSTGLIIAYLFFMPWLNALVQYKIPFAFSSPQMIIWFFGGLILFITLMSGIYPSVYISRFEAITILKGKEKFGQRSWFSRALLTTQFVVAFTTIVGCFVFIDNAFYLKNKDWGYNHEQNITVPVNTYDQYLKLRDLASSNHHILSHAGSANHIGHWNTRSSVEHVGERFEIVNYMTDFNYAETMNLRLKEGRLFDEKTESDRIESVVVNENFVKAMGWTNALNQTFVYDSVRRNVIGVVNNFHYDDFYRGILPVMFTISPEKDFKYISFKVAAGHVNETHTWIKDAWKKIAPDDPYEGKLQDEVFANFTRNNTSEIKLLTFVSAITLLLACLGLFGLVAYNITRRLKEFSIRKVFGANISHIFRLMNRDYIWILSIAFIIGAPTGFFLMDTLIHHVYAEPQSAGLQPFIIAISLMILTVALTIALQMNRIVKENPVKTLRNE